MPAFADENSPATQVVRTREQAIKAFPQFPNYEYVHEDFEVKYGDVMRALDEIYQKNGGLHLIKLEPGEANLIVRLLSRDQMVELTKATKQRKISEERSDDVLLQQLLMYPQMDQISQWCDRWAGAMNSIMSYIMTAAKSNQVATGKKLFNRRA